MKTNLRKGPIIAAMLCLLFSNGCFYMLFPTSSQDLDQNHPFVDLQGTRAELKRPVRVVLVACHTNNTDSDVVRLLMPSPWRQPPKQLPQELPAGTQIEFDSFYVIKNYVLFCIPVNIRYEAWFTVPDLKLSVPSKFEYIWGNGLYLHAAPWEGTNAPPDRYVGFNGKSYSR